MTSRMLITASCAGAISASFAAAQSTLGLPDGNYIPQLGDIMGTIQLRHFKLSFVGKLRNWELAAYELDQINESFQDAATLYRGITVADMTSMADPVQRLGEAILAKDLQKFPVAFTELTAACDGCHHANGRSFIVVQVPTSSPFNNQKFEPATRR